MGTLIDVGAGPRLVMDGDGEDSPEDVPRLTAWLDHEGEGKVIFAEAQTVIEAWRLDYNQVRPHSALGDVSPAILAATKSAGLTLSA